MNIFLFKFVTRKLWLWELLVIIALILFISSCSYSPQAPEIEPAAELPLATATAEPTSTLEPSPTPLATNTPTILPSETPAPTAPTSTTTPDLQATAAAAATQIAVEKLNGIKAEIERIGYPTDNDNLGWIQDKQFEIVVDEYGGSYYEIFRR